MIELFTDIWFKICSLKRVITLIFLTKINKNFKLLLRARRVQMMLKNSMFFISMKMLVLHLRNKRRFGFDINIRLKNKCIRNIFTLVNP